MKQRSRAGGQPDKQPRRKRSAPKHRNASKVARNRGASVAGQETVVARLTHERDEALLRETANSEILSLISRSPDDLELVFQTILEHATRICNANFGNLFRFDGENFYPVAQFNTPAALLEAITRRGPFKPTPGTSLDYVMHTKQVFHSADMAAEPVLGFSPKFGGARSQITVPMLKDHALIGAILIYRQEVRPFTEKQIELVKNFAAQAVIAIENARLLNELRQSLQQQTATADVLEVISRTPIDLQPVLTAICETVAKLCETKDAEIFIRDGDRLRLGWVQGPMGTEAETWPITRGLVMGRAVLNRELIQVHDLSAASEEFPEGYQSSLLIGHRTIIAVPLMQKGEAVGVLTLRRSEVKPFTDKQITLLRIFADQAVIAIENTRLLTELRQSLEQQTATADVLRVISSSLGELGPVFGAMLENATRICEAKFGILYRCEGDALRTVAMHDAPQPFVEARRSNPIVRPNPDTTLGRAMATKQPVQIADILEELDPLDVRAAQLPRLAGARTVLAVPMIKENELVGAFVIYRTEVRPFNDKQIALVQNFAAQAVIAIENARLLNELRESLDRQTATADVLRVISSSPGDLEPVFNEILEKATRICRADYGSLLFYEGDAFRAVAQHNMPPEIIEKRRREPLFRPGPASSLTQVAKTKEVVQIPDITADQGYLERNPERKALLEFGGYRSILTVPILKEKELIGAFNIFRREVGLFDDKQIALVQNFADQAVIAIENARLLNELRQSLERQTATADVLRVISSSPGDLQPVFEAMLRNAVRICDAQFGNLALLEGDGFRFVAQHGAPQKCRFARERETFVRTTSLSRVIKTKQIVHVADIAAEEPQSGIVTLGGARTLINVPMLKENELIGIIAIYRQEVRPFTEKQVELLQNFAAQAVIAIENARLLKELRERTEEVVKLNQQLEQRVADQVGEIERMSRLRRFLPPQVADLIVASGTEKQLESHRREITALFCDLRGFTGFSESSDPEDVIALLRDYHAAIGQIIVKYSGTLERFAGDGVMVIFNDPVPVENPALQAVLMALDMRTAIGAMIEKWRDLGHDLGFGIGIAHGFATLGTIGFEGRFDYAAIGTVSNVASRLCDEAKPGQILISPRVRQAVDKVVTVEPVSEFTLKGIRRPMMTYNVAEPLPSKPN
jgi:GAF domain-containing protein